MKKGIISLVILLLMGTAVWATENIETNLYYVNVPVLKVYQHRDGYVVYYRKTNSKVAQMFIPKKWFSFAEKKAIMGKLNKEHAPFMTVYYKGADIDHIRLSMPTRMSDPAWGVLPVDVDVGDKFNTDAISIEY